MLHIDDQENSLIDANFQGIKNKSNKNNVQQEEFDQFLSQLSTNTFKVSNNDVSHGITVNNQSFVVPDNMNTKASNILSRSKPFVLPDDMFNNNNNLPEISNVEEAFLKPMTFPSESSKVTKQYKKNDSNQIPSSKAIEMHPSTNNQKNQQPQTFINVANDPAPKDSSMYQQKIGDQSNIIKQLSSKTTSTTTTITTTTPIASNTNSSTNHILQPNNSSGLSFSDRNQPKKLQHQQRQNNINVKEVNSTNQSNHDKQKKYDEHHYNAKQNVNIEEELEQLAQISVDREIISNLAVVWPSKLSIVFEVVEISRFCRSLWIWKYDYWPTTVYLEFGYPDQTYQIFEIRQNDIKPHLGVDRYVGKRGKIIEYLLIDKLDNVKNVYEICNEFVTSRPFKHENYYDKLLNYIPLFGWKLTKYLQQRNNKKQNYWTSYDLIHSLLREAFPFYKSSLEYSEVYSVQELFIVITNLFKNDDNDVDQSEHIDIEDNQINNNSYSDYSTENNQKELV